MIPKKKYRDASIEQLCCLIVVLCNVADANLVVLLNKIN